MGDWDWHVHTIGAMYKRAKKKKKFTGSSLKYHLLKNQAKVSHSKKNKSRKFFQVHIVSSSLIPFKLCWVSSVHFSLSVVSDSLWPHESQHARPPCLSPTPGVYPNSCPSSWWCHPAMSSSVIPFSSCPHFQHQGLFQWVKSSHEVAKVLEFQLSASVICWVNCSQIPISVSGCRPIQPWWLSSSKCSVMTFPGGSHDKESACDVGDLGSIPGLGRSAGGGHGGPL